MFWYMCVVLCHFMASITSPMPILKPKCPQKRMYHFVAVQVVSCLDVGHFFIFFSLLTRQDIAHYYYIFIFLFSVVEVVMGNGLWLNNMFKFDFGLKHSYAQFIHIKYIFYLITGFIPMQYFSSFSLALAFGIRSKAPCFRCCYCPPS